jgi:DNA helicase-2/ATP-dependent DNA helicase PcrA
VSRYEALQLIAEPKEGGQNPPFDSRASKALAGFVKLIDGFRTRSQKLNMVDLFDLVVEGSGYKEYILSQADGEERWENILELRTVAQQYRDLRPSDGLTAFLEGVTLVSDVDGLDESVAGVTLITMHQAKGLEFPVVFIVGMEEGILPHFKSFDDAEQMEEERRLCYVGITRAKRRVYLVRAFRRNLRGSSTVGKPSRFLEDIPRHLTTNGGLWWGEGDQMAATASAYSWNRTSVHRVITSDLKAGDHVYHTQFGDGVVVSCQPVRDDKEIVVAFNGAVKKLLLSSDKLERIK